MGLLCQSGQYFGFSTFGGADPVVLFCPAFLISLSSDLAGNIYSAEESTQVSRQHYHRYCHGLNRQTVTR